MGTFENQQYLSQFIVENSSTLASISEDNPELFNAIGNALDYISKEFGTGETTTPKKEIAIPKTQVKIKKEGKAIKPIKAVVKVTDLIQLGQHFIAPASSIKTTYKIGGVDEVEQKVLVTWEYGLHSTNYIMEDAINNFLSGRWIPTLADGTPLNLEIKKEEETPISSEFSEPLATAITPPSNIKNLNKIKLTESDLIKVGSKFYNKNKSRIYIISDLDENNVDFDFNDDSGDTQTETWRVENVKAFLNDTLIYLDDDNILKEVELVGKMSKRKTKTPAQKIADLQLQLETQQLLAEIGDSDAIEEVKNLTEKIESLKKKQ